MLDSSCRDIIVPSKFLLEVDSEHFPEHTFSHYQESLIPSLRHFYSLKMCKGCISHVDHLIVDFREAEYSRPGNDSSDYISWSELLLFEGWPKHIAWVQRHKFESFCLRERSPIFPSCLLREDLALWVRIISAILVCPVVFCNYSAPLLVCAIYDSSRRWRNYHALNLILVRWSQHVQSSFNSRPQ